MKHDEILKRDYSDKFDELRKAAVIVSHYKYGAVEKTESIINLQILVNLLVYQVFHKKKLKGLGLIIYGLNK